MDNPANNMDLLLDQVDYGYLNSSLYKPTPFALSFVNFTKMVNEGNPSPNKTPPVHLKMLDKVVSGERMIVNLCHRGLGKALALDTKLVTPSGWTTVRDIQPGQEIIGEDGKPTKVVLKSEVFDKPMYRLHLADGRYLDVSEDHINVVIIDGVRKNLYTTELLNESNPIWIPTNYPIEFPTKILEVDPYTFGSSNPDSIPLVYLRGSVEQRRELLEGLYDSQGNFTEEVHTSLVELERSLGYGPDMVQLLCIEPIPQVKSQCLMVDNESHTFLAGDYVVTHNTTLFFEDLVLYIAFYNGLPGFGEISGMIYVSDSMENGVKGARQNLEFKYVNSEFCQKWIPHARFTENYIEFKNAEGKILGIKMYGATTGIRGSRIYGKRPQFALLDDLISDVAEKSPSTMELIKDCVYKGVNHALDPKHRLVVLNGTPFNKTDIMVEAVESGAWAVNLWPVCERFPCSEEDFRGSWEDRFGYEFVKEQYDLAVQTGKLAAFNQELMLRLTSEEDRLVRDYDLRWYSRAQLLKNRHKFNFYITTDFAVSDKKKADFSTIFVWAYNANGDFYWVDGISKRQTFDKSINDLFKFVAEYRPQAVGVENSGTQKGFIPVLQNEQMYRNVWFTFAASDNGELGIRPVGDKLTRFNLIVPKFKAGKFYFPTEMKTSNEALGRLLQQIALTTTSGIKGKDDCIDATSQLGFMKLWLPSDGSSSIEEDVDSIWSEPSSPETSTMSSYIV